MYSIEFFDASGNDTELIINYNFNRTAFYCDGEGNLAMARIYQPDLSKKVLGRLSPCLFFNYS